MKPKISIALATYNGAAYLQEQLDSYISQSRLPDELVISDDGSTDGTIAICENFARKAPFEVKIHTNSRNLGPTKNFENAISRCTGDFIFLSDQDDIWLPDKICALSEMLINKPDVGAAFCNARMCNENLVPLGYNIWEALGFSDAKQKKVRSGKAFEVFLQYSMIAGMTMVFRSAISSRLLPFPDLLNCHDIWILLLTSSISDISFIPDILTIHRVHGRNASQITKKNLYQQYLKAKAQIRNNRLAYFLQFHKAVLSHQYKMEKWSTIKPGVQDLLQQKINHLQIRVAMPKSRLKRIFPIIKEIRNCNYKAFSYGVKSALQDLLIQ